MLMENFLIKYIRALYELDKTNAYFIFNFGLTPTLPSIYFPNFVYQRYSNEFAVVNFKKLEFALQIESIETSSNIMKEIAHLHSIEIHTDTKWLIKKFDFLSLKKPHTVKQIDKQLLKYFGKILSKIELESV